MNWKRVEVFAEFLVLGILIGVAEDILAIKFATGEEITPRILVIVVAIAIPFAFFGEYIVDRIDFVDWFTRAAALRREKNRRRPPKRRRRNFR